jgi:hypothetical protein
MTSKSTPGPADHDLARRLVDRNVRATPSQIRRWRDGGVIPSLVADPVRPAGRRGTTHVYDDRSEAHVMQLVELLTERRDLDEAVVILAGRGFIGRIATVRHSYLALFGEAFGFILHHSNDDADGQYDTIVDALLATPGRETRKYIQRIREAFPRMDLDRAEVKLVEGLYTFVGMLIDGRIDNPEGLETLLTASGIGSGLPATVPEVQERVSAKTLAAPDNADVVRALSLPQVQARLGEMSADDITWSVNRFGRLVKCVDDLIAILCLRESAAPPPDTSQFLASLARGGPLRRRTDLVVSWAAPVAMLAYADVMDGKERVNEALEVIFAAHAPMAGAADILRSFPPDRRIAAHELIKQAARPDNGPN